MPKISIQFDYEFVQRPEGIPQILLDIALRNQISITTVVLSKSEAGYD